MVDQKPYFSLTFASRLYTVFFNIGSFNINDKIFDLSKRHIYFTGLFSDIVDREGLTRNVASPEVRPCVFFSMASATLGIP